MQQDDGGVKPSSARAVKRQHKQANKLAREEAEEVARRAARIAQRAAREEAQQAKRRVIRSVNVKECAAKGCGRVKGIDEADPRMKTCGRCRAVCYCGPACQLAHWHDAHKNECVPNEKKPAKPLTNLQQRALDADADLAANPDNTNAACVALLCRVDAHVCRTEYKEAVQAIDEFLLTPDLPVSSRFPATLRLHRIRCTLHQQRDADLLVAELTAMAYHATSLAEVAIAQAEPLMRNRKYARALKILKAATANLPRTNPRFTYCMELMHTCYNKTGKVGKARVAGAMAIATAVEPEGWESAACVRLRVHPTQNKDAEKALEVAEAAEKQAKSDGSIVCHGTVLRFQRRLLTAWLLHEDCTPSPRLIDRWMQLEERIMAHVKNYGSPNDEAESIMQTAKILHAAGRFADAAAATQQAADIFVRLDDNGRLVPILSSLLMMHAFDGNDAAVHLAKQARDAALLLVPKDNGDGSGGDDDINHVITTTIATVAEELLNGDFYDLAYAEFKLAAARGSQDAIDNLACVRC
jgi:tetratricopeptide (TPR) repeat protein